MVWKLETKKWCHLMPWEARLFSLELLAILNVLGQFQLHAYVFISYYSNISY